MTVLEEVDAALAAFLAKQPKCPACGVECVHDFTNKTIRCFCCERTWTKMQMLQERRGRERLAALAEACNAGGSDPPDSAGTVTPDQPTLVRMPPIGGK